MWNMFANCTSLSDLDISQFDLRKVENMEGAFHNCLDSLIQKVMSQNEYLTKAILK
jgi:surface protein